MRGFYNRLNKLLGLPPVRTLPKNYNKINVIEINNAPNNIGVLNYCYGKKGENHPGSAKNTTYRNNPEYGKKISKANIGHDWNGKNYIVITPQGQKIDIYNLNKFCRNNKLNVGNMCLVAQGKRLQHKGFKVRYA